METPISHLKEGMYSCSQSEQYQFMFIICTAVDAVMEFNKAKYEQELKACAEQHAKKVGDNSILITTALIHAQNRLKKWLK